MESRPETNDQSTQIVTWVALAATFVLLFAHAAQYRFLTDDAFISFRYAVNFVNGDGLVFNPGQPPVEGYTNFLWVLLLSIFNFVGIAPETAAHILSFGLTVVLWGLLVWYVMRKHHDSRPWLVVMPLLFLAATRSVAVWSSGGLETRLFEVLVVGAVLRLIVELEQALQNGERTRPWSVVLLALATLTRPDGMLISACALGTAGLFLIIRTRTIPLWLVKRGAIYAAIVGAHFLFRRLYYGDWLPNTYYAKVGGQTWWGIGTQYLGAFLLEYATYLWLPFLIAALIYHVRKSTAWVPALMLAVIVPHTIYIVSIGGDHFEFRPFDLYFPMLFLLMYDGACWLARGGRRSLAVGAWAVVVLWGLVAIPLQSHLQFPDRYISGFPGFPSLASAQYLAPERDPIYRLPLLRDLARTHRSLLRSITFSFSGLRQEEHTAFLDTVAQEGRKLRQLVVDGTLPPDTHIAVDAVGAIPYYSALPVLDRLGLTDREIAHSAPRVARRLLAHDKHASFEYARRKGVDLWAVDNVHIVYRIDDPAFAREVWRAKHQGVDAYVADLGEGFFLFGRLPQGPEAGAERFRGVDLIPIGEMAALEPIFERALRGYRAGVASDPTRLDLRFAGAAVLNWLGRPNEALSVYEEILQIDPRSVNAHNGRGLILLDLGDIETALESFDAALSFHPDNAIAHYNRALALSHAGRTEEALSGYRAAIDRMPFLTDARINLGLLLVREGRVDEGLDELERVVAVQPDNVVGHVELAVALSRAGRIAEAVPHYQEALRLNERTLTALNNLAWIRATNVDDRLRNGDRAVELAEAACQQTRYSDPFYLTTLGVAYAEAGRFDDALRTSRRAIELGADQPQLVQRVRQLMRIFESRRPYREPASG